MRRLAKATSAFNFGRSGSADGRDARSFAGRGLSLGVDGSGASSHRRLRAGAPLGRLAALTLAATFLLALAAPQAHAAKSLGGFIGGASGGLGDQFNAPRDVAVSQVGAGVADPGDIYVIQNSSRVSVLDAAGNFKFVFGWDVIAAGRPGDLGDAFEKCTVAADCKAGSSGTFVSGVGNLDGRGGQLANPQGIEINQATGDLYVREIGQSAFETNRRISVFDAAGNFKFAFGWDVVQTGGAGDDTTAPINEFEICTVASQCQSGSSGAGAGQFLSASTAGAGLAISPISGDVFASDPGNRRINQYDASGNFIRAWGYGVDTGAAQFQVCTAASTCQIANAGANPGANGQLANNSPAALTVDSQNVVYATDVSGGTSANRIVRFDADAAPAAGDASANLLGLITPTGAGGPLLATTTAAVGLAIDPDTDGAGADEETLLASRDPNTPTTADTVVQELDIPTDVGELPADPVTVVAAHTYGASTVNGLGLSPITENLLVPVGTTQPGSGLIVLAESPFPLAAPTIDPAANIEPTTADLSGDLDPGAGVVSYQFEISSDGTEPFQSIGAKRYLSGAGSVPVSALATGLDPNTFYQVRLAVTKQSGVNASTTLRTAAVFFLTDAAPPEPVTLPIGPRTDTSAELRGTADPNGTATTYWFEYGPTAAYGSKAPLNPAPAGSGNQPLFLAQQVAGLLPATTYHYRIVADGFGPPVNGPDKSFTTRPTPVAQPGLGGRGLELVSPAFKVAGMDVGYWRFEGFSYGIPWSGFSAYRGERFATRGGVGSILTDGAHAFVTDTALTARAGDAVGWQSRSPFSHPSKTDQTATWEYIYASSPDLSTMAFKTNNFTPVFLDGMGTAGWNRLNASYVLDWGPPSAWEMFGPTSADPFDQIAAGSTVAAGNTHLWDIAFSDDGSTAVGATRLSNDLLGNPSTSVVVGLAGPGDPTNPAHGGAAGDLLGGRSIYLADLSDGLADSFPGDAERELVNVCTGAAGAGRTALPAVNGSGDLVAEECPAPLPGRDARLISPRGATLQVANTFPAPVEHSRRVVSEDGSRVFFLSPDPLAAGVPDGRTAFCTAAGQVCPPQLYVRQRNEDGSVVTRWLSRPVAGLLGSQDASLTGAVRFEDASADGSRVFFRTNSPLTLDDRNGTGSAPVTAGTASNQSWDLYMLQLAPGDDPMGSGAQLTRISAGPTAAGDCNGLQDTNMGQQMLRFAAEDGSRAYFACSAPLPGVPDAQNGTVTLPGGTPTAADQTNLYSYRHEGPAAQRWRFVARLPRGSGANNYLTELDACAGAGQLPGGPLVVGANVHGQIVVSPGSNCVRGSADGEFVTFFARARLTADDPDEASFDIYAYDDDAERLTRVTAAQGGPGGAYVCAPAVGQIPGSVDVPCHGDGGWEARDIFPLPFLGLATDPLIPGDRLAFFQSKSRLVPGDQNDTMDVYQWRNGDLSLVSSGAPGAKPAYYKGNDASGRNVFFYSDDRLTWQDVDAVADIYTARVDGGIPEPVSPPACDVLAGGCQPPGPPVSAPNGASSAAFHGEGNVVDRDSGKPGCANGKVRRGNRCVAKRTLANRACAKRKGKAKRRCVNGQMRRLNGTQQRQGRAANTTGRAGR